MNPFKVNFNCGFIPAGNNLPPTLYSIMQAIVNFEKEEKITTKNLSKEARKKLFDFDYPLSLNISKEKFETMILNHFMMRRIGFDTVTLFQLQLENKLNTIMPIYNKMFDSLENWNIFNDGEVIERSLDSENKLKNNSNTTSDRRFSDLPENNLENVRDGKYVTNYNYDNNNDNANSEGTAKLKEITKRSPANKIEIYKEFQENINNIYNMIYKDLDCLFYQIAG